MLAAIIVAGWIVVTGPLWASEVVHRWRGRHGSTSR
jgi:hypothetical protein